MRGAVRAAALSLLLLPAAWGVPQAAGPFEEVILEQPGQRSYRLAYFTMTAGVAMIGASFVFSERATSTYGQYERATDPDRIEALFQETQRYDRISNTSLLVGQVVLATGLYLRFLHGAPDKPRVRQTSHPTWTVALEPRRCALVLQF